ncbi:MAG: O-antigen ligase family protein, partial [Blastocatellia bacterium]
GKRLRMIVICGLVMGVLSVASPGGFGKRVATILSVDSDKTGSSSQRRDLLIRALSLASVHPLGIGLSNYHAYSLDEEKAHNAYLETSVELGILGLIAYLIINLAPIYRLWRFEREMGEPQSENDKEARYICIGLQGTLIAYLVCSFFASIQYYWFLYYPVAHTIAFCQIYRRDRAGDESSVEPMPDSRAGRAKGGILWQPNYAQSGVMWSNSKQLTKKLKRG